MDFSTKFGIGYLLSNYSSGFYFNDGTSLILSSDKRRGHYFQPGEENKKILVRESFLADEPKESVRAKLEIMQKFDGFLQAPLSKDSAIATTETTKSNDLSLLFVVKFFRTSQATFFRLSHRILQVNFFDHCKLIFSAEGQRITFLDPEKRCLEFSVTISRVHLPSGITGKLQYVSDIFHNMMKSSGVIKDLPLSQSKNKNHQSAAMVKNPSALGRSVFSSSTNEMK